MIIQYCYKVGKLFSLEVVISYPNLVEAQVEGGQVLVHHPQARRESLGALGTPERHKDAQSKMKRLNGPRCGCTATTQGCAAMSSSRRRHHQDKTLFTTVVFTTVWACRKHTDGNHGDNKGTMGLLADMLL